MIFRRLIAAILFIVLIPVAAQAAESVSPAKTDNVPTAATVGSYVLGPGDVLEISVWKDEALTRTAVILPDGTISFPLAGEISAAGKTVAELKGELERKLVRYVPDLVLTVEVKQVNSMIIYILGRVNSPGRFLLNTKLNVLQALALAGGLNPFADQDAIKIYHYEGGKTVVLPFRYSDVAEKNRMEQNVWLRPGDTILVP